MSREQPTMREWMEAGAIALIALAVIAFIVGDMFGRRAGEAVFRFGFMISAFAVPSWFGFRALEDARHRAELRKRELARIDRENERLRIIHAESAGNFFHVDTRTGDAEAYFRPVSPRNLTVHHAGGIAAPDSAMDSALPIIAPADCALICGGRGAGKTTLAQWAMAERARAGSAVIVIDPKPARPRKWPGARIVGADHDYQGIARTLGEISARIRIGRPITVLIDEINLLNMRIPGFPDLWLPILLEGREYGAGVWIIGQSRTAGSLGLAGKYDLLECFDLVVFARKDRTGRRWAEVEAAGMDTERFALPGPFPGAEADPDPDPETDFVDAEWTAEPEPARGIVAGLLGYFRRPEGATNQTDAILATIHRSGRAMAPGEIAEAAGLDPAYTRQALRRLLKTGKVASPRRGYYEISP